LAAAAAAAFFTAAAFFSATSTQGQANVGCAFRYRSPVTVRLKNWGLISNANDDLKAQTGRPYLHSALGQLELRLRDVVGVLSVAPRVGSKGQPGVQLG